MTKKQKTKRGQPWSGAFPNPAYGFCRTINHTWGRAPGLVVERGSVVLELRCPCGTRRFDRVSPSTGEVSRGYTYPKDYRMAGPVRKPELRVAFIKTLRRDGK